MKLKAIRACIDHALSYNASLCAYVLHTIYYMYIHLLSLSLLLLYETEG